MGPSPLYFPVIDQPSALTSQRTGGVLQVGFECCFVLNTISKDEESSATNRISSAQIAQKLIFWAPSKKGENSYFLGKSPVKTGTPKERATPFRIAVVLLELGVGQRRQHACGAAASTRHDEREGRE